MHRWHEIKPKIKLNENKLRKISLYPTELRVIAGGCSLSVKLVSAIVLTSLSLRKPPYCYISFHERVDPPTQTRKISKHELVQIQQNSKM